MQYIRLSLFIVLGNSIISAHNSSIYSNQTARVDIDSISFFFLEYPKKFNFTPNQFDWVLLVCREPCCQWAWQLSKGLLNIILTVKLLPNISYQVLILLSLIVSTNFLKSKVVFSKVPAKLLISEFLIYKQVGNLESLRSQISWSHNLIILPI